MARIARVESSFNPYAIGVVGGRLDRQPQSLDEALATAQWLERNGYNFSVGLVQVNKKNFARYGLTLETAFQACPNVRAGGEILKECYVRALRSRKGDEQAALRDSFSCYYSGNFITGYNHGYVLKVVSANLAPSKAKLAVPRLVTQGSPAPRIVAQGVPANQKIIIRGTSTQTTAAREDATADASNTAQSSLLF
ncbi:hypothetical protein AQB9606_04543 [Aquabacterium sp. CECT 9606]|nr:hypothetical protein AQB9606_04543 [Aquabacterium sp. CECT 9606]